jgi:uncharacterized sulfatase
MNLKTIGIFAVLVAAVIGCKEKAPEKKHPNILFAISDDQSFAHTSFEGSQFVNTPAFDKIASEGVYFVNCSAGSPGCAPSRSAIATGRHHWQNEQSGQHASSWLKKHIPFIDLLENNAYQTGRTGKGVSPFRYAENEQDSLFRKTDAGGVYHSNISYNKTSDERVATGISNTNYFENFKYFMENTRKDKPFFFWYGAKEPHRGFEEGSWKRLGKKLEDAEVPDFLPDTEVIRGDLLDYAVEIEWFDLHLQRMLDYLEQIGELDNTIVIVTSDNGMAFPSAKANAFEYGIHVPMAIRYPKAFPGGRKVHDPIGFIDIAPTILELTETSSEGMLPISGNSIVPILKSEKQGLVDANRKYAFSGRERHSSSRYLNWGYPQRVIRTQEYIYIWNAKPDRWPTGAPERINPADTSQTMGMYGLDAHGKYTRHAAFTDIDDCPSKTFILENYNDEAVRPYFDLIENKRPEFELYNIKEDPYCRNNLAGNPLNSAIEVELNEALFKELKISKDPRVVGPDKEIFDSYLRYSPMREFRKPN